MQTHKLIQGSPEWDEFRSTHFGASEAAAMLGISKKVTRNELLKLKATGSAKEFNDWVQRNVLDKGHELEALARPIIEAKLDEDLYPVTCSKGSLSASCDGLTIMGDIAFEHKQWNQELAQSIRDGVLPDEHWPQCQQILMITGAGKLFFTVSDGTEEKMEILAVYPDESKFAQLQAGWLQFEQDLANYEHREIAEKPQAEAIKDFPVATLQARGELMVSNLDDVLPKFDYFLANQKTELITDDDFANGEAVAKFSRETADKLKLTAQGVIDQIASVSDAVRTLENYAAKFNALGLQLEKLVKSEKEARRNAIISEARMKWVNHLANINTELGKFQLRMQEPSFLEAVKNKRTIESLHNAVDTTLANSKIDADALAMEYRQKLAWLGETYADFDFLFNDLQTIISKPVEDFQNACHARVEQYQKAQQVKEDKTESIKATPAKVEVKAVEKAPEEPPKLDEELINEFLSSRQWKTEKERNTARAICVEFSKFLLIRHSIIHEAAEA